MDNIIKRLNTLVNKRYCHNFSIHDNTFYLRTEYQGTIYIKSETSFDFYDQLIERELLSDFIQDLCDIFNSKEISIIPDSIIRYPYSNTESIIQFNDIYLTYVSQTDPRVKQEESINNKLGKYCAAKLLDISTENSSCVTSEIIHTLKKEDCRIVSNDYEKLVFTTDCYFIKAMQNIYDTNDLAHEGYIIYQLNKIGPNFPKFICFDTLGYVFRAAPVQDHWDNPINYLVVENVVGIPLKKFLLTASEENIKDVITQVFYALYDAQKIEFTHYDLHIDNILIKPLDRPLEIEYSRKEVITKNLAVIIDLEFSFIKVDNCILGVSQISNNIYNKSFWIHDIFKIVMSLYKFANYHIDKGNTFVEPLHRLTGELITFLMGITLTMTEWNHWYTANPFMNLRYRKYNLEFSRFLDYFESLL